MKRLSQGGVPRWLFTLAFGIVFTAGCSRTEQSPTTPSTPAVTSLELITSTSLSVTEPSGLCYVPATNTLWMISDNSPALYRIDTTGKVLGSVPVVASDIEGIAASAAGDTMYIVEETASRIAAFRLDGSPLWTLPVLVRTDTKHSLEGITVGPAGRIVVINEKLPMMLLAFAGTTEVQRITLGFTTDISDVCYDAPGDCYWIVSDESQKVIRISRDGSLLGQWSTPVNQGEGIAVIGNRLYIVSDAEAKLYVFHKPT